MAYGILTEHGLVSGFLNVLIDGQDEIVTGNGVLFFQPQEAGSVGFGFPTAGVHFNKGKTIFAAQLSFPNLLQTALTDDIALFEGEAAAKARVVTFNLFL